MKKSNEYSKTYFMPMANGQRWQLTAADPAVCEFVERYGIVCSMSALPDAGENEKRHSPPNI